MAELPERARQLLLDSEVDQTVSVVTIWEIAIKHARHGARAIPLSGDLALRSVKVLGLRLLDITGEHAAAAGGLPPIHGDPFDRMLVAQALTEPMRLLTTDATLARYSDTVILV